MKTLNVQGAQWSGDNSLLDFVDTWLKKQAKDSKLPEQHGKINRYLGQEKQASQEKVPSWAVFCFLSGYRRSA